MCSKFFKILGVTSKNSENFRGNYFMSVSGISGAASLSLIQRYADIQKIETRQADTGRYDDNRVDQARYNDSAQESRAADNLENSRRILDIIV